jgi:DNA-binding IclR family transcriptional regulator
MLCSIAPAPELHTGSRVSAYCTSMGKLMLANLPETEQRELMAPDEANEERAEHDHQQGSAARGTRGDVGALRPHLVSTADRVPARLDDERPEAEPR